MEFNNGLILQFGTINQETISANSQLNKNITFPQSYTKKCGGVCCMWNIFSGWAEGNIAFQYVNLTSGTIAFYALGKVNHTGCQWITIGI